MDGQLSFSAHSVAAPMASASSWEWKTGMIVSMPRMSWEVAARRAIFSASRCASGNQASTSSIISRVTTELSVQAGTLSTRPRYIADRNRRRGVIHSPVRRWAVIGSDMLDIPPQAVVERL